MEKGDRGDLNFPPKKVQSEPTSDYPAAKKLARQLDFNSLGGAAAASPAASTVILPENPQRLPPPMQPPLPTQPQSQPHILLTPTIQPQAPAQPLVRPFVKPESPKAPPRPSAEVKDGTPKKQKQCNCKHSRCLKLYCECFASGIYCDGCNCVNCHNNVENEAARREAIETTLERNPNAFRPKIASSPHGGIDNREEAGEALVLGKHNKGCHCKKSGCLKKYCECFQANILCSDNCKCMDCKNFEGSEERQALFHGDHANNLAFIAANAAITGAIGSSGYGSPPVSKKRKGQELFFGSTAKDPSMHRLAQFQQPNHVKASAPAPSSSMSSVPGARVGTSAVQGTSKFVYRSLLADIIQSQDVKELCSVLVVYSQEAGKMLADEKNAKDKQTEDQRESLLASSSHDRLPRQKESEAEKAVTDECSSRAHVEKINTGDSSLDGADASKGRPMSPGTLALMCDEQDTVFTTDASPNRITVHGGNTSSQMPHEEALSESYAEVERVVLTKFRDCMNRLVTLGEIKEMQCSSLARSDSCSQTDAFNNCTKNARSETRSQQEQFGNGFPISAIAPTLKVSQWGNAAVSNNGTHSKLSYQAENGDVKLKPEKEM